MNEKNENEQAAVSAQAEAEKILADARAEAEKIVAEAKKAAKDTEKKQKNNPGPDPAGEELVEYTAPLLGPEKGQDVVVGVNGKIIRIQRGQTVKIPRKFVEVLEHAQQQAYAAYLAMEAAKKQSDGSTMNL